MINEEHPMLDPVLLDSFLAVAQTRNVTEAGRRLGLRQSTVSQHVRKLEEVAGRRVRFGTSEDFVSSRLPEVLRDFVQRHPLVDLELTVDLSASLNAMVDDGALDVALCKRRAGDDRGRLVWRDRLAWIGTEETRIDPGQPLPLILYTPPSITRTAALETLERLGRPWRIVCSSGSLSGLRAAALAGLGVTVHARGLMPEGLSEMPAACRLPELGEVEFVVQGGGRDRRGPPAALAEAILASGDRLQRR
ncbi:MAG TPA: LysR family transcriptional regulator [Acetobacteraceae bacterium]|nr:LysR family transcriptional regulator [Acetobacteraceae bacterium]